MIAIDYREILTGEKSRPLVKSPLRINRFIQRHDLFVEKLPRFIQGYLAARQDTKCRNLARKHTTKQKLKLSFYLRLSER